MSEPVSIRTKNPGAMWPCAIATQFGSTSFESLADGNRAAVFPTCEQGAAAQFALWAKNYSGMPLQSAIYRWSGHNSSDEYATFIFSKTKLAKTDVITRSYLSGPNGLVFMKAQAQWEAGRPYPMTDDQWRKAQELAFGISKPVPVPPTPQPTPKPAQPASGGLFAAIVNFILAIFKRN